MKRELKHWKTDVPAGLVVFLVAIPLCLGIALASGSSALSGVIAGIVGGLVVTLLSNSHLGVSGPAAGLIAIVAPAITQLGFQNFLVAVALSGVIQFALGIAKAGTIGYYFPTSVIKGMLAAIGLLIILKQIPHAFGYDKDYEGDLAFQQADGQNTFSEIGNAIVHNTPAAVVVSVVCLAILIFWETKSMKSRGFTKIIQGPLVAVVAGIVLSLGFGNVESMKLKEDHLVQLPASIKLTHPHFSPSKIKILGQDSSGSEEGDSARVALKQADVEMKSLEAAVQEMSDKGQAEVSESLSPMLASLRRTLNTAEGRTLNTAEGITINTAEGRTLDTAEGRALNTAERRAGSDAGGSSSDQADLAGPTPFRAGTMIFITALTLAIVASLESLLCAEATDKLDPQRRKTDLNRELRAQGIGNFVSGIFGGLPVTQVIVRSSTNIQSGAQSRLSSFVHGVFLVVCVVAIPGILNLIPLASLAAILLVVGYKLAHPSKFKAMYRQGWTQFLPFIITITAILYTDLLVGIAIGLVASVFFILKNSFFKSYWMSSKEIDGRKVHRMTLAERVFFINKGGIQAGLSEIEPGSKLVIDATNTVHVDQDVVDVFDDFETNAKFENIEVERLESLAEDKQEDPARVRGLSQA